jgi:hypothetical protein
MINVNLMPQIRRTLASTVRFAVSGMYDLTEQQECIRTFVG